MINSVNVHRSFGGVPALTGLNLHAPKGKLFGIMGPGGSGKSTFCKVACGLVAPDSGMIIVDGMDLGRARRDELQKLQQRIGIQFQNDALFEHRTVLANVEYPLTRLGGVESGEIRARAMERLAMVGLAGFEERMPSQLSGGQRRRVALARACVTDPDLLICDDPTAGLDPVTSRRILDMIAGIKYQTGGTVVLVSSDVLGLLSVSETVALFWGGTALATNSPAGLWSDQRAEIRRFLDDARIPVTRQSWV